MWSFGVVGEGERDKAGVWGAAVGMRKFGRREGD